MCRSSRIIGIGIIPFLSIKKLYYYFMRQQRSRPFRPPLFSIPYYQTELDCETQI